MRATSVLFSALTLFISCLAATAGAQTDVSASQLRDYYATAKFHVSRPDPNNPGQTISTVVSLIVDYRDWQIAGTGGWAPNADAIVLNIRDSQSSIAISSSTAPGQAPQLAFHVDENLGSARLVGTMTELDYVTRQPVTFTVDLTWNPEGPVTRDESAFHTNEPFPGGHILANANHGSEYRPAVATGTLSINSVNYTPLPSDAPNSDWGKIGRFQSGDRTITVTPGQ